MFQTIRHATIVGALVIASTLTTAGSAQAGPVFDWLFGPPTPPPPAPVVSYYPPAYPRGGTAYAPAASYGVPAARPSSYTVGSHSAAQPYAAGYGSSATTTYRAPSPSVSYYAPAAAPAASCSGCQAAPNVSYRPTVAYQAPQNVCPPAGSPAAASGWGCFGSAAPRVTAARPTYYRTSWKQIPVTSYRPVTSRDPVTGCAVTVMKPCTTYSWQAERRRCGFFGRLFGLCETAPAASACCPTPCPDPCAAQYMAAPSCCGAGVPMGVPSSAPVSAEPYYPTPASPPAGSSILTPGPGATPADIPPSLTPGEASGIAPPRTSGYPAAPAPQEAAETTNGAGPSGALNGPENSPAERPAPSATLGRLIPLPIPQLPVNDQEVRPIPGPQARPAPQPEKSSAPQLLETEDRMASLRGQHAWAVTPIAWPTSPASRRVSTPPARSTPQLDDSGWRSVAQ